jgi:hypothetical protein
MSALPPKADIAQRASHVPRKRTFLSAVSTSALCHKQTCPAVGAPCLLCPEGQSYSSGNTAFDR